MCAGCVAVLQGFHEHVFEKRRKVSGWIPVDVSVASFAAAPAFFRIICEIRLSFVRFCCTVFTVFFYGFI